MEKKLLYNVTPINTDVTDLNEFEEKVKKAAHCGATHILVTEIPKSRWIWERDLEDPYPNWGMLQSALFKIIIPEELSFWLPQEEADKNLMLIQERTKILRKYKLKAYAYFCEPFYLPEGVFRAHPAWRGPRCEHPRRAKNYYYSPCMDQPEVLDLYRNAMKKLCEAADIDYVYLHTNDCGAGICWSEGLYPGANGPESCRNIPIANRILNYFRVFKEGAKEAGRDISIETNSSIGFKGTDQAMNLVWPVLEDGMAVNFKNNKGLPLASYVDITYEFLVAPIRCIPLMESFARQLEDAYHDESNMIRLVMYDCDNDAYWLLIEEFFNNPTHGIVDRMNLLRRTAARIVCSDRADTLVDVWMHIENGMAHFLDTGIEGFSWTSVNQRLINRPFVLFPNELTDEEKLYYRRFQYQAIDEDHANDLLDNQCTSFVRGYYAVSLAKRCLEKASGHWRQAADKAREISELLAARFELLLCFVKNYENAMCFQEIVDSTDYDKKPEVSARWPIDGDPKLLAYEQLTRNEVDNTYKVITLLSHREQDMLVLAPAKQQEDIFWLSPDIVSQLEKKATIMLNHQLDGKRLYVSNNK